MTKEMTSEIVTAAKEGSLAIKQANITMNRIQQAFDLNKYLLYRVQYI